MKSRVWGIAMIVAVTFVLISAISAWALKEPDILFDIKTDKKISRINILGQEGEWIFLHNKEKLWMHDGNTGKKIWEDKVPGYTDDGLDLIWNQKYFITSMKKGMRCYDLATGKIVWEVPTEVKMKTFKDYVNFSDNFILIFNKVIQSFNPDNGEVQWTNNKFDISGTLESAGLNNIYQYHGSYGDRLLLLGDKQAMLYNAADGKLMCSTPVKWDGGLVKMREKGEDVPEPLANVGDNMVVLFFKEGTTGLNIADGTVAWNVEESVDRKRGYVTFDHEGSHYALFGFKKKSMLMNLDTGKIMWETGEDMAMEPQIVQMLSDGTLFMVGHKKAWVNKIQPFNVTGSFLLAYGLDLQTGKPKWGPSPLVYSIGAAANVFGMNPQMVVMDGPWVRPDGFLFYVYGQETRVPDGDFKKKGGEGLVLLDPMTGEIKWRTDLTMYANWAKNVIPKGAIFSPIHYKQAGGTPPPVFVDDVAYLPANNTVVKIDLNTGKTLWEGPDYSFVYTFTVDQGRVFGPIGYAEWGYEAKGNSAKDKISKTKRVGYFVLDSENGKQKFAIEKAKIPLQLFLDKYDPKTGRVYLCDGEVLRGLNLLSGEYDWELNLDKQLNGEIGAKNGVIFKTESVNTSSSIGISGGYTTITTSTTTSYSISMEHGVRWLGDRMLVLAKEGPAMVNLDGSIAWKGEWDWKTTKINFSPKIVGNGIVYQYKNKLTYLSLKDGSIIWQTKEKGEADFAFDDKGTKVFVIENKAIASYRL